MARFTDWFPVEQRWFRWGLVAHVAALLLLAHWYDMTVFQDASRRLASGEGIYAPFSPWYAEYRDGYYAYPPVYAYMLWASGRVAAWFEYHWWIHQILIKAWLFLADLVAFGVVRQINPNAARTYWTLWFVPLVAIAQVQPDLWVGLAVLMAFSCARQERWTAAGLALAVGIGLKGTPLFIVPFLLLYLGRWRGWRAVWQVVGALVVGALIVWIPYLFFYDDGAMFVEILNFHLNRPALGINIAGGLRSLIDASTLVSVFAGRDALAGMVSGVYQQISDAYFFFALLAFGVLGLEACVGRWSLEMVFGLPLLVFLLANKVVNEQYLLQVMPLLLVMAPEVMKRFAWPYSIYLIAAGTPLRFFPREYGLPSTVEVLLPQALQPFAGPLIALTLAVAIGAAALLFSYRVLRLIQEVLLETRSAAAEMVLASPEAAR